MDGSEGSKDAPCADAPRHRGPAGLLAARLRLTAIAAGVGLLGACASGPLLTLTPQPRENAGCAPPGDIAALRIRRIAVLPFAGSVERRTERYAPPAAARLPPKDIYRYLLDDGNAAADSVEGALLTSRAFSMVERRELDRILSEQRLQLTGLVSAREAAQIGKLSGADAVLLGKVDHAYAGYENITAAGSWVGTYVPHAGLSLRLVHVESGTVAWTCQLSRNALNYLDRPLTLGASATLAAPHAQDAALMGATVEERIQGIIRATARDALGQLLGR